MNFSLFYTILFFILIVCKLTHNIDISWIWVTCPLWIGILVQIGATFLDNWINRKYPWLKYTKYR